MGFILTTMKNYIVLSLAVITFFTSCQPILRTVTGIKKPEVESYKSIENYIHENNLPIKIDENYFLTKNEDYKSLAKFRDSLFRLPDIYLFNKQGQFIEENQYCTSLKIELSDKPNQNYYEKILKIDSLQSKEKTIKNLEILMNDKNGEKIILNSNENIAIVLWAKFLGKKNKKFLNDTKQQLENTDENINIYFLNIDTLESWEE